VSTILLADDNPHAQRMGTEILSQEGHTVVAVADGDAALAYLAENQPALILADITMPGLSGYEVCHFVKTHPEMEHIKVVLLRGPLEPLDQAKADQARPDGLLQKPLDATMLIGAVASLLDGLGEKGPARKNLAVALPEGNRSFAAHLKRSSVEQRPVADAASLDGKSAGAANPFAALVERALQTDRDEAERRSQVRAAVAEVFESMTPALIDRVTERVLDTLRKE
jgi:CheY-like chemotaxis protein